MVIHFLHAVLTLNKCLAHLGLFAAEINEIGQMHNICPTPQHTSSKPITFT